MVLELGGLVGPGVGGGDPLGLHHPEGLAWLEPFGEDEAAATGQRAAHDHGEARRPEERKGAPRASRVVDAVG